MQKKSLVMPILVVIAVIVVVGLLWLNSDISKKHSVGTGGISSKGFVEMSDDNPTFVHWGQNFPDYLGMYLTVEREQPIVTEF